MKPTKEDYTEFFQVLTVAIELSENEKHYQMFLDNTKGLDEPLWLYLDEYLSDTLSNFKRHYAEKDLNDALDKGYYDEGTEQQASLTYATHLLQRTIRKLK